MVIEVIEGQEATISLEDARLRLNISNEMFNALLINGFLGPDFGKNRISITGLEHFERFGTQWDSLLAPRRVNPKLYEDLKSPVGAGMTIAEQPSATYLQIQLVPKRTSTKRIEEDTGWFAQFYLRPNPLFFSDPNALGIVGPLPLKLESAREVPQATLPTHLYPDSDGSLGMVTVIGNPNPVEKAFETAYNVVSPILDELSIKYDHALPIAHWLIVRIPSGTITLMFSKPPKLKIITKEEPILPSCPFTELRDAIALFREGLSSNNPFHSFITLWRAYENACHVRGQWRRKIRRKDLRIMPERFPNVFAFAGLHGLTFEQVKQKLNDSHRIALAHGYIEKGEPLTAASAEDFLKVSTYVPVIRYMAKVTIDNVRHTLRTSAT